MNTKNVIYGNVYTGEKPTCSQNGDPRRQGRGLPVTSDLIKFGIAKDFTKRFNQYLKTFNGQIENLFMIETHLGYKDLEEFEKQLKKGKLNKFRCINPNTGRKQEWLHSISVDKLKEIIINELEKFEVGEKI